METVEDLGDGFESRRAWVRARLEWRGQYRRLGSVGSNDLAIGYLIDISAGGAGLETHGYPLGVGERVLIRLGAHPLLGIEVLQFVAVVCNVRPGRHQVYGVEFANLTRDQRELLIRGVGILQREGRPLA